MKIWKIAASAAVALCGLGSAHAANLVKNGSFEADQIPGRRMAQLGITDWVVTPGPILGTLLTLNSPGTADSQTAQYDGAFPGYFAVYPGFPTVSPDGGNFIQGDGDLVYADYLSQEITGLTVGQQYELNFYQAASQQGGSLGPTTERWQVSFGSDTQFSKMYSLPEGGMAPWEKQTMRFTAGAGTQVLQFLASGTPTGAPPISFLDGVSLTAVPEPATWAMMIMGFAVVGGAMRRRHNTALLAA